MEARLADLVVHGPDGQTFEVPLGHKRVTIGRLPEYNEVALQPDPEQRVTRHAHCIVEREDGAWWIKDNDSRNGVFLRQQGSAEAERVHGRASIANGDVICIVGRVTESGEPVHWELTLRDPKQTQVITPTLLEVCLDYNPVTGRLFRAQGSTRTEIVGLPDQARTLVDYMASRNRSNNDEPVLCTHDEIIRAIWGEDAGHTPGEVNRLVWDLRRRLGVSPKSRELIENVPKRGYRLKTCSG